MPSKIDQSASPTQKILNLFSLLLFTGRKYSLTQLANILECSKQTIGRITEELALTRGINLKTWMENGQKWFQIESSPRPHVSLSPREIQLLGMCKQLVLHLLPRGISEEVEGALNKTTALLPDMSDRATAFDSICEVAVKGVIDYTPFQDIIETTLRSIRQKNICEVVYQAPHRPESRTYCIAPAKIMSYRESLYILGFKVTETAKPSILHEMTLAIHRIKHLSICDKKFDFPDEICELSKNLKIFGILEQEQFEAIVKFKPKAAQYVRERTWSEGQCIKEYRDGSILLKFTAQSEPEVISWVLSFGAQATLIKPISLRDKLCQELNSLREAYNLVEI